jgi:hypothetical protein
MEPLVSILIPAFNAEAWIGDAVRSARGKLEVPRLRWKYAWIKPLFGWGLAKRAELFLPQLKINLLRFWDRAMYSGMEECQCDDPSDSRTTTVLPIGSCAAAQFEGKQQ